VYDMAKPDKIQYFMTGLKPSLYAEVDRREPQTLEEAMTHAQRAELRGNIQAGLYRGSGAASFKQNRYYNPQHRSSGYTRTSSSNTNATSNSSSSTPMELGKAGLNDDETNGETLAEQEYFEFLNELQQEETQDLNEREDQTDMERK